MEFSVIWSNEAQVSFLTGVDFIQNEWSNVEATKFIIRTENLISQISKHPFLFKAYKKSTTIRCGILHKNTTLYYEVEEKTQTIKILLFWNNQRNPNSLYL